MKILTPVSEANQTTKCYASYTSSRAKNANIDAKLKAATTDYYDSLKIENTQTSLTKLFTILTQQKKESLAVIGSKHQIYKELLANLKKNDDISITKPGTFKIADQEYNIQSFNFATPKPMYAMHMRGAMKSDIVEINDFSDDQFEAINSGDALYTSFTKRLLDEVFTPYMNKEAIINQDFYSASNVISTSFQAANEAADKSLSVCLGLNSQFNLEN